MHFSDNFDETFFRQFASEWDVYFNDTENAYTFVNVKSNLMAVIMPMKVDGYNVDEVSAGPDFRDITPEVKLIESNEKPAAVKKPCKKADNKKRRKAA